MPAIKVRCAPAKMGEYRGRIYVQGSPPFFLVDRKDELGNIRLDDNHKPITAELAFADYTKDRRWGWMIRMEATREELLNAQMQADFEDQPSMFTKFNAGNSGEAAGGIDLGGIGTQGVVSGGSGVLPTTNAEQFSVPGGGAESGQKNLSVI